MKLIAHRGYTRENIKENTMLAFQNAFQNGFTGIEFDVRVTKDNRLVVCHDAFIDRVSSGRGLISSYTYEELLKFNFGSEVNPSKIVLCSDVLKSFKGIKVVELKTRADLSEIFDFIDDNTYFISFDTSYIFKMKRMYPQFKFGLLNYVLNSPDIYNLDLICLLDLVVSDTLIKYFMKKNIAIFIYSIKDKPKITNDEMFYIVDKNINLVNEVK